MLRLNIFICTIKNTFDLFRYFDTLRIFFNIYICRRDGKIATSRVLCNFLNNIRACVQWKI